MRELFTNMLNQTQKKKKPTNGFLALLAPNLFLVSQPWVRPTFSFSSGKNLTKKKKKNKWVSIPIGTYPFPSLLGMGFTCFLLLLPKKKKKKKI